MQIGDDNTIDYDIKAMWKMLNLKDGEAVKNAINF